MKCFDPADSASCPEPQFSWVKPGGAKQPLTDAVLASRERVHDALCLRLTDTETVDSLLDPPGGLAKQKCGLCASLHNNRLYCYHCLLPLDGVRLPALERPLPLELVVIRDPSEKRSKSSALHAHVIARGTTTLELPLDPLVKFDPATACVVFPSDTSFPVADLPNLSEIRTVIVLDSSWANSRRLSALPQLIGINRVQLRTQTTFFWRYQRVPDSYLATIEAIYYFFVEHHKALHLDYDGGYDNLLSIYCAQFRKILRHARYGRGGWPPPCEPAHGHCNGAGADEHQ
jgi:DTW domain-containing protein YfiP